ncbi:MAG: hypothetical protein HY558_07185 [Euryarchaeota archaeon]|nr:hypothetical protein [Euryarchaeota archaeon]
MSKPLGRVVEEGVRAWRREPRVNVPQALQQAVSLGGLFLLLGESMMREVEPARFLQVDPGLLFDMVPPFLQGFSFYLGFYALVNSLFIGASIAAAGMASRGEPVKVWVSLRRGARLYPRLAASNAIINLLTAPGMLFLLPSLGLREDPRGLLWMALGWLACILYILGVSILFWMVRFSIGVGDRGLREGLREGLGLFRRRLASILLLWLLVLGVGILLGLAALPFLLDPRLAPVGYGVEFAGSVVFTTLITVWFTQFYLSVE